MSLLVEGLGDDGADAPLPQQRAVVARRVGLIGADPVWSSPRPPAAVTVDFQMREQMLEDGAVAGLAGPDEDDQGKSSAVDELVDLGAQPTARSANAVVRRLDAEIFVIRPSPLCGG